MPKKILNFGFLIGFLDLVLLVFLLWDLGFADFTGFKKHKLIALPTILLLLIIFNLHRYWQSRYESSVRKSTRYNLIILGSLVLIELVVLGFIVEGPWIEGFYETRRVIEYGLLFYFLVRFTFLMRNIYELYPNPLVLFVGSYILVILSGTLLLLLPNASTSYISFTDTLFTATSAVCVTGLLVVDVGKDFTIFGQSIIMILIQLGGLGLLTFTSFFAYFFKSGGSFRKSLYMKMVLRDDQLSDVMEVTVRIVVFALIVEAVGFLFIYNAVSGSGLERPVFFSLFHAISGFNNAGISTLSENLQAPVVRFNYYLQWIIMGLIIFGGLGYFISFNFIQYMKQFFINLFQKRRKKAIVRIITLNTKLVVYTTLILIVGGSLILLITEYNTVLTGDETFLGKLTTSTLSAVAARTCGFNTVDYSQFSVLGLLLIMLLMWIGASPNSTGGGIKTSSFAIAILNVFSTARNKPHIEIGTRRIAPEAVRRAFAIIVISLLSIGLGIVLLHIFNPEFSMIQIAFEAFSAFGTVGYSMGITPELSLASRYVIIFMMFFGRIGLINLMAGILHSMETEEYEYPEENIMIN